MSVSNINNSSRISGIISGMDTDTVVDKMTINTTSKIDKINAQIKLLQWKQEDYSSIISKLKSFKATYLSTSGGLSSKFYASKVALTEKDSDSKYVGVSVGSNNALSSVKLSNIVTATKSSAVSQNTVSQKIEIGFDSASAPVDLTGKTLSLTVDGITKTITFNGAYSTAEELSAAIKQKADEVFGTDRLTIGVSGGSISINSDGTLVSVEAGSGDVFGTAGLTLVNAQTSRLDLTKSISENSFAVAPDGSDFSFTINGQSFSFTGNSTISSIINTINSSNAGVKLSYSSITDKFTMTSTETGAANGISISDETGNFLSSIMGTLGESNYTQGTDASVYIDGVKVTRASNTFTIDDVTYTLKANTSETITVNVENNIDTALSNIKQFVADYNDLLNAINTKINETRYKDYAPLTKEQEAAMTETEISKWNEKARSGLLKNDSTLSGIATALRQSMYSAVSSLSDNSLTIGITLADIGIRTESYSSKGKLVIDEDKLKTALANRTEEVISLFAQKSDKIYLPGNSGEVKAERFSESGLMYRLSDIMENSVGTLYSTGSLLKIAGSTGTSTEVENTITKSITSYKTRLKRLELLLSKERNRYYSQFSAMEKAISDMNSQISSLYGQ